MEALMVAFLEALDRGNVGRGGLQDGRVVDVRPAADRPLYLVGDLHAKVARIADILGYAGLEAQLQQEQAVLVFLGDLFHPEADEEAGDMESSIDTLMTFMRLKVRFPRSVYVLLGNHEFTRTESHKRGYFQGHLFRSALETRGLAQGYDRFLRSAPLVVIHPRCVGVHAGPAMSLTSFEELKRLEVTDAPTRELPRAVLELTFSRHVDWSPNPEKAFNDYHIADFLALCGIPEGHLITGHTPLARETGWEWDLGKRLTVIFAAGREVGFLRVTLKDERLVRVGRSLVNDDRRLLFDRTPPALPTGTGLRIERERGRVWVRLDDPAQGHELLPDVVYRFDYPGQALTLHAACGEYRVCHYRHLSAASQAYYPMGYYFIGQEFRQEVLRLKRDLAVLLGGPGLCEGVRFSWDAEEFAILRMLDEGAFEVRALVDGVRLSCGSERDCREKPGPQRQDRGSQGPRSS
ncbi:MAG: metallophosphoesterase [Armatimonadetes bacterium]|nr:metallophosphoesterase [Armatimonadota bacterium]